MAEKKELPQKNAEPDDAAKKKKLIIIGAAALILLIGIGVGGFFLMKKPPPEKKEVDPAASVPVPELNHGADLGPMVDITEFIVNIISADGNHYVKTALTLELTTPQAKDEINQRMPQIRDAILLLIGNKTFEELQDLEGKRLLKAEIMSKINGFLQAGKVKSIFFTEFVVQ
ncbi:MAG: flagellar basal body-associated FliL family protein [Desulfocapsaceae bacterium]|nr:flagellar basal body-associated FliL family protein [Desulfocapsaceae bacterium]